MEPISILDLEDSLDLVNSDDVLVHDWRVDQLRRAGVSRALAEVFAESPDWRDIASLVRRGCPPVLALEIVC
jgi:hypothetical protein